MRIRLGPVGICGSDVHYWKRGESGRGPRWRVEQPNLLFQACMLFNRGSSQQDTKAGVTHALLQAASATLLWTNQW